MRRRRGSAEDQEDEEGKEVMGHGRKGGRTWKKRMMLLDRRRHCQTMGCSFNKFAHKCCEWVYMTNGGQGRLERVSEGTLLRGPDLWEGPGAPELCKIID